MPVTPAAKPRASRELLLVVIQPISDAIVAVLARTRIDPQQVVLAHTVIGFVAAWLLSGSGRTALLLAALLLQLKSLLDNVDGGLARSTGRVTQMGRYLDTIMDLAVNVALFWALTKHGSTAAAWGALLVLTAVLSVNFNAQRRHAEERAAGAALELPSATVSGKEQPPAGAPAPLLGLFLTIYALILGPQDSAYRWLDEKLFALASGVPWSSAPLAARRRWADLFSAAAFVNLGLSTQLLLLGLCAALGMPYLYVVLVYCQPPYVIAVQVVRVWRYRRLEVLA